MDIIIVIVILGAISYFRNKRKREEAERKKREAMGQPPSAAAQNRFQPAYSAQQPPAKVPDPRFPDYAPAQRQQRPAPDPRFPDYTPTQRQHKPAPDPRFPDLDDVFKKGFEGLRNKVNTVTNAVTDAQARNLKEQLDEINRRKQEAQNKRKVAPALRIHVEESSLESHAQDRMDAPPEFSMHAVHDSDQDIGEGPPRRQTQGRREQPRQAPAHKPAQPLYKAISSISRDKSALVNGIVLGEILGKPKALRR